MRWATIWWAGKLSALAHSLTADCTRFSTFTARRVSDQACSTITAHDYGVRLHLLRLRSVYRSSSSGYNSLHGGFHYITLTSRS